MVTYLESDLQVIPGTGTSCPETESTINR